jgi:hypothetical protein
MRNFRLGEWLPEAMTPLFADWLLERFEHGYLQATRRHTGAALGFPHATINGWYYTATARPSGPGRLHHHRADHHYLQPSPLAASLRASSGERTEWPLPISLCSVLGHALSVSGWNRFAVPGWPCRREDGRRSGRPQVRP